MIHFMAYSIFTIVSLIIIISKYCEIQSLKNKNGCSILEAIKIYINSPAVKCNEWPVVCDSDDYDERFTHAYRNLSSNVHYNRYDD